MSDIHSENMSIEVDHEIRRLLFAQWGPIDKLNAIKSFHFLHDVAGFDPGYDTLVDYRNITEVNLDFKELMNILKDAKEIEKRTGRGALVVGQDKGRYIFAQLFCEVAARFSGAIIRYKAFKTIEEAEIWLDGTP